MRGALRAKRKSLGRLARRHDVTARLLTEWRAHTLIRQDVYEDLRACREHAQPGSLVLDVGASVGNYAAVLSKSVGRPGTVLALEAQPAVFEELRRSTRGTNVLPLNLAASSTNGWVTLTVPVERDGQRSEQLATLEQRGRPGETHVVRAVRLDDLIEGTRPVSLIKIDVEGHEMQVLLGLAETIERCKPALVVEIEARHTSIETLVHTVEHLLSRGYNCVGLHARGRVPWQRFDVQEHQLTHLSPDLSSILPGHEGSYVNNFLFTPRG